MVEMARSESIMAQQVTTEKNLCPERFWLIVTIYTIGLFLLTSILSLIRHGTFKSSSHDLGIFNQALWQISNGFEPISSFIGHHILSDHASLWLYVLAIPYSLYKNPETLLILQALAVGAANIPLALICKKKNLSGIQVSAVLLAYCLYPAVLNISLFDFHPDLLSLPFFFLLFLAHEERKLPIFIISAVAISATKAVMSLSVAAYGLAILMFEKDRIYGQLALGIGAGWYIFATRWIIPEFSNGGFTIARHLGRFQGLGNSFGQIASNLLFRPYLFFSRIFSNRSLTFLVNLFIPVAYVFFAKQKRIAFYAIAIAPTVFIILLSSSKAYVSLSRMYMLPLIPYLMMAVVHYFEYHNAKKSGRHLVLIASICLSIIGFIKFTDAGKIINRLSLTDANRIQSIHRAIRMTPKDANVYTSDKIAAHMSGRNFIRSIDDENMVEISRFDYLLLDKKVPGWRNSKDGNKRISLSAESEKCKELLHTDSIRLFQCPRP